MKIITTITRKGMNIAEMKRGNSISDRLMNSLDSLRSITEMTTILVMILLRRYFRI